MHELIKKGNVVKITMNGGKIIYGGILDNSHSYIKFLNKNGTLNNVLINGIESIEEYDLIEEDDILFDEYFKLYQERENLRDMIEEIANMLFEKNNLLNQQKAKMVECARNKNIEKVKKQQEEVKTNEEKQEKSQQEQKNEVKESNDLKISLENVVEIEEKVVSDDVSSINVSSPAVSTDEEVFFDETSECE